MVRSSQATDMYNNLAQANAGNIANYANELLANSQAQTAENLTNLLLWYMNGYNVLSDTQKQSLSTSQGNATKSQSSTSSSFDSMQMAQLALSLALKGLG